MDPRIVVNGRTGKRIVFGDYGIENGVEYLDIAEVTVEPGEKGPPSHAHLLGDEEIEVLGGRLGVRIDGAEQVLEVDEMVTIPQGAVHEW